MDDSPIAENYRLAGTILSAAGLHRRAIQFLEKAIELDDQDPFAWHNLGMNFRILGRQQESDKALIRAMTLDYDFVKTIATIDDKSETVTKFID